MKALETQELFDELVEEFDPHAEKTGFDRQLFEATKDIPYWRYKEIKGD